MERVSTSAQLDELDAAIAKYTSFTFEGTTSLMHAGLDSLTLLRIAVDVASDEDTEIDASGLVKLRTIDDLKGWLLSLSASGAHTDSADPEAEC
jgi:hypothetical protein